MSVRIAPTERHRWLLERIGYVPTPDFSAIEAFDGDRIFGMVGLDAWKPNSVQMHVAFDVAVRCRRLIPAAFAYVFNVAGKGVALATISSNNRPSLSLAIGAGFREVCRLKDAQAQGIDHVILEMRREDCRWLRAHQKAKAA